LQICLSYEDLHSSASKLSASICEALGTQQHNQQNVIPVLLPQCPNLYIAILAILKAGAAFCPLNLDAPPDRVKFILGDVAAKVVVTTRKLASRIPSSDVEVLTIGESECDFAVSPPSPINTPPEDASLAYVMYTSGSTGTPKGVGISHRAATQSLLAHDRVIPSFKRFLQFAAPTFDVSVFEIFFPFFRGATLVSLDRSEMLDDLPGALTKMDVDACELTPSVAGSLLRSRSNVPTLKLLLTIGEMLSEPIIKEFGGDAERPSMLWAMYGPTEAAIHWYA
jgi:non-ribosomal peptide synthetase component F